MAEKAVARVGDTCTLTCSVHGPVTGTFFEGTSEYTANGLNVVLVDHRGTATCGHQFKATSGSAVVSAEDKPVVRVGDTVQFITSSGVGEVLTGSPTVFAE